MALKKKNTNSVPFGTFCLEKHDYLSDVPLPLESFLLNYPKSLVPFTFQPIFPETFCKWSTTHVSKFALDTDMARRKISTVATFPVVKSSTVFSVSS